MAANSPRKSKPLPISALPLPSDEALPAEKASAPALPTNSSGELTPAQRARLGLDIYGDEQPPAPTPISNGNGSGSGSAEGSGAAPSAPKVPQPTEFGFTEIDPYEEPAGPEPALAPVRAQPAPKLAPATPAAVRTRHGQDDHDDEESTGNAGSSARREKLTVAERDGIAQMERDRKVLSYGASWTAFCIFVTAAFSFLNVVQGSDSGPSPGTFAPAMISIVLGWIVVFVGRNMKNWGWLMIAPAVVLVLGPFFYTSWRIGQLDTVTRSYMSSVAAKAEIDTDPKSVVSETINTAQGCFALTKDRDSGDVRVDVVTYAPATAQQQATMALAPRYARRVAPGGARVANRSFTLAHGSLPVVTATVLTPPIDCANAPAP